MKDWKSIPKQVFKSLFFHFISDILFLRKRSFAQFIGIKGTGKCQQTNRNIDDNKKKDR